MGRDQERLRGVTLRLLNTDAICATVSEQLEAGPFETVFDPYAAAQLSDGTLVVICGEGVGWEVTAEQPFPLELYAKAKNVFPSFVANLTAEQVLRFVTDEPIDPADLVRKFGGRLEDNFWLWRGRLSGSPVGS